jgi:hypothetical protein
MSESWAPSAIGVTFNSRLGPRIRVQSGADRGRAHVHFEQLQSDPSDALDVAADDATVSAELLTETNRHRVLQVRAPHLDHPVELSLLRGKGFVQAPQLLHEFSAELECRDANPRGEGVVGGLRHVDVAVRADHLVCALRMTEQLEGAVCDHLVGVHVDRRSGAALDRIDDKMIVEPAGDDVVSSARDGVGDPGLEVAGVAIGERRRFFYDAHGADERRVDAVARDGKVLRAAKRLDAVIGIRRDLALAEKVVLHSELG